MKSIRTSILINMILTVSISLLILGSTCIIMNYKSTESLLQQSMTESARIASEGVSKDLKAYTNIVSEIGSNTIITDPATSLDKKKALIAQKASTYGFERGNIIGVDGISIFDGKSYAEREYFQEAMQGKLSVSEPLLSKVTGKLAMIIAAPLWKDAIPKTTVIGVVYFAPPATFLNDLVETIKVSPRSSAYVLDKDGYTIAHVDISKVENHENVEELAKTDSSLADLGAIHSRMSNLENGFGKYKIGRDSKFTAFAPIEGSHSWSIGVTAFTSEFTGPTIFATIFTIILILLSVLLSSILAFRLASFIGNPIKACTERLELLSHGNLQAPVPQINLQNETGRLASATESIVNTLNSIILDESYLLGEMAQSRFNIQTKAEDQYVGDFQPLLNSIRAIIYRLSNTLVQINISANEVSGGSEQVSCGAQSLSQGATEQASSVEELSSTIANISMQVHKNAEHAANAKTESQNSEDQVYISSQQMEKMIFAIKEISNRSDQIGKIVKTIEDIAFQTNILALNAAVEAARAGASGKGFAVVADEVRNLAGKSGEAAKNTTALINETLIAVQNGSKLADAVSQSMSNVVTGTKKVSEIVSEISNASSEQATSIAQVTLGIEQISAVIHTNSATAQQSAAASEELNSQAQLLKDLVNQFELNQSSYSHSSCNTQEGHSDLSHMPFPILSL